MARSSSIMGAPRTRTSWSSTILQSVCLLSLAVGALAKNPLTKQAKTAADYFVSSLPGQPDGPLLRMHAGHIEITPEHNGNLFFWLYENRHIADRRRTVIWLNGGPGCSSEDGALMEIGPYRVGKEGKLSYNEGSWDEFANLLFVDNPVGTGFSYVDGNAYLHELQEMADNFVTFLEKFFEVFPAIEMDDIYIAGESYAGQHIPYIARAILDRNKRTFPGLGQQWNLKGLLIGNGWISGPEQYQSYSRFAYERGLIQGGTEAAKDVESKLATCLQELNKPGGPERVGVPVCESVLTAILDHTKKNGRCVNMYDIRLDDTYDACGMNWPPDLENVTPYLRRADVVKALNIDRVKREGWSECSGAVISTFRALKSKSAITLLPGILESGVPILLFSGDADLICNHIGTEDLISNMRWSGGSGFQLSGDTYAPRRDWQFEGQPAGIYQEARNLTYVKFFNASHMVPFDWPRRSRDMLDRFMQVDIASIGGKPADSLIDGEKAHSETSVGGHPNSTSALDHEKETVHKAKVEAYYRSGEAVLVVVIIISLVCAFLFWRNRRRSAMGVGGSGKNDTSERGKYMSLGAGGSGSGKGKQRDVEAGDFDENELDDLSVSRGGLVRSSKHDRSLDNEPYDLASDTSIDDSDVEPERTTNKKKGKASENEKV